MAWRTIIWEQQQQERVWSPCRCRGIQMETKDWELSSRVLIMPVQFWTTSTSHGFNPRWTLLTKLNRQKKTPKMTLSNLSTPESSLYRTTSSRCLQFWCSRRIRPACRILLINSLTLVKTWLKNASRGVGRGSRDKLELCHHSLRRTLFQEAAKLKTVSGISRSDEAYRKVLPLITSKWQSSRPKHLERGEGKALASFQDSVVIIVWKVSIKCLLVTQQVRNKETRVCAHSKDTSSTSRRISWTKITTQRGRKLTIRAIPSMRVPRTTAGVEANRRKT